MPDRNSRAFFALLIFLLSFTQVLSQSSEINGGYPIEIDALKVQNTVSIANFNANPNCPKPTAMGSRNVWDTTATLFLQGNASQYQFWIGPPTFHQATSTLSSTIITTTADSLVIDTLSSGSCLEFMVRSICTTNDTSDWLGPYKVCIPCSPISAPYTQNWDAFSPTLPYLRCFFPIEDPNFPYYTFPGGIFLSSSSSLSYSPSNLLSLNNSTSTYPMMVVSPPAPDLTSGDKQLVIRARVGFAVSPPTQIVVGTMGNMNDIHSFHPLDTFSLDVNYNQAFKCEFTAANGYNGTDQYFVVAHGLNRSNRGILVDDLIYEVIPACSPPPSGSLGVSGVGVNTAAGVWGSGSSGDATIIEWGTTGFTPGTGAEIGRDTVGGNVDAYTMTGMAAQSSYDFYIADSCVASGISPWVGPYTFTTACNIVSAPFIEEFDGSTWVAGTGYFNQGGSLDPCWRTQGNNGAFSFKPRATAPGSANGPITDLSGTGNFLFCEVSNAVAGDSSILYMPIVDVSSLTNPALYFYQHRFSNGNIADMQVDVSNDFGVSWTTVYTVQGDVQTSAAAAWSEVFVNLPQYANDTIQVRFIQKSKGCCGDAAIDSIAIVDAPSCLNPTNLTASNILDTAATLSWVDDSNAQINQFWFAPAGFNPGLNPASGTQVNLGAATSIRIDTLDPQTCYDFFVRTICGPGDTSMWVGPIQVCTRCSGISAPHYENWDTGVSPPRGLGCYSSIEANSLQLSNFVGVTIQSAVANSPPTGPNYLELDNNTNVTDDLILVSPLTNDLTDGNKRLRFTSRETSFFNTADLIIGTMSDPANANTFNPLDTIDPSLTWLEYTVNLDSANGYNGTDLFFAFAHDLGGAFDAISIDEIHYEQIPTCYAPHTLAITSASITDTSATATWVGGNNATNFQIEYGIGPLGDSANTRVLHTGTSILLNGLTPGSAYCVWVREICTPYDTSSWSQSSCFTTLCSATGYIAPYFTDFEGINIGTASGTPTGWENCWTHSTISGTLRWESEDASGSNENSLFTGPYYDATFFPSPGGTYMYLETSSSGGPAELSSPLIDISSLNNPELYYHYHMFGATINYLLVFAEDANGRILLDSIAGQQQTAQADSFYRRNVPLKTLTGTSYNFVFQAHRGTSVTGDISIDDVGVDEGPSCPAPAALRQTGANLSDATVTWTGGGSSYELEYGPAGFTRGTGTIVNGVIAPYLIGGLTAASNYEFYVKEVCSPGDTSAWSLPGQASTLVCDASSKCIFRFDLLDTFGDGWNGAEITIYQNGVEVGKMGNGFTTGSLFQDSIDLCNGLNTAIVLTTAGGWPEEIGLDIYDPSGAILGSYTGSPSTTQGDTLIQFQATCASPCQDPTALAATANVGCDSIEVTWTSVTGGSIIEYGPAGFAPGTGVLTGIISSPFTLNSLSANTPYDVYLADTCNGDTSNFITTSISTASTPQPSAGYTWSSIISGNQFILYLDASSSIDAGMYHWDFGNGVTGSGIMDTVTLASNGRYRILLTVTNACGTDTISQLVNVNIGLQDNPLSTSLSIYPNPGSKKVNLSFREVGSGDVEIRLRDAQGREVMMMQDRMQSGNFSKDIDVSTLARGIYMVEVKSGGFTAHRRLSIR